MSIKSRMTALANAIRTKFGVSGALTVSTMTSTVETSQSTFAELVRKDIRSLVIPATVSAIGASAFRRCEYLTTITVPSSVTSIGEDAFCECYKLASISLPMVTTIGEDAFKLCNSLTSITMPSIVSIGSQAFSNCHFTTVTLPSSVRTISEDAFINCSHLTDIYCGFAEGAVSGAPWGATDATIHYNSTGA